MRHCTKCGDSFEATKTMTICKPCNNKRIKSMSPEDRMYRRSKMRAKELGREFSITMDDIFIPTHCPILGIELKVCEGRSGGTNNSPSLDRKDSSRGYSPDNVWVISRLANQMKTNATKDQMQKFAEWVITGNV